MGFNPWNERCYSFCLSLSFVYPVFGFIIPWVFGANGNLAGFPLLLSDLAPFFKILIVLFILGAVLSGWLFSKAIDGKSKRFHLIVWIVLSILSVFLAYAFRFPYILILGIAANSVLAAVHSGITSTLTVFISSVIMAAILMYMGSMQFSVVVLIGGSVLSGLNIFWNWFRRQQKSGNDPSVKLILIWNIFWFLIIFLLLLVVQEFHEIIGLEEVINIRTLLCLFVLLPLINAPLDWLSLGLTRGLLMKIQEGHHKFSAIMYGLIDLVVAAIFWLLTLTSTILLLSLFNKVWVLDDGLTNFDLSQFLVQLASDPWNIDVAWIHVLAATTLIPTFLHFFIATFALINIISSVASHKIIGPMLKNWPKDQVVTGDRLNVATLLITLNVVVSLVVPMYILSLLTKLKDPASSYIEHVVLAINTLL